MSEELRDLLRDVGLLVLRIGIGTLMIVGHGYPKWANFAEVAAKFHDPLGVGAEMSLWLVIFAELFCSVLVILGLATRFAAIPVVFAMCVAAFVVNAGEPLSSKELAIVYAVPFLTLVFTGPGRISLDAVIGFLRRE